MRSFKSGRFVDTPHGHGVVFDTKEWPVIVVHLINEAGETAGERSYQLNDIKLTDKPLQTRVAVK